MEENDDYASLKIQGKGGLKDIFYDINTQEVDDNDDDDYNDGGCIIIITI